MNTIAYLVYGNDPAYHLELTYSVLTLAHHLRTRPADIRIVLVTDETNRRPDLPVEHLIFSASDLARWTRGGAYNHEAKVHALLAVMDRYQGRVALVDTDTYFRTHPGGLFQRIGARRALMHADEGRLGHYAYWRPIVDATTRPIAGYRVTNASPMHNSGVVGVDYSLRKHLDDVAPLMAELYAMHPVFNIEQFALTCVLRKHTTVEFCPDIVWHYWGHERKFMHAQIKDLFQRPSRDAFERHIDPMPRFGYPHKSKRDQLRALIKAAWRRQGRDYRFAYLAYRCALSSNRREPYANVWAQVALDALSSGHFNSKYTRRDFRQFAPDKLSRCRWLTEETRDRWLSYWERLAA